MRGAYLVMERERAQELGYASPVWATLEETHSCYSACLQYTLEEVAEGRAEVLLGSHNEVRREVHRGVQGQERSSYAPG